MEATKSAHETVQSQYQEQFPPTNHEVLICGSIWEEYNVNRN